MNNFEFKIGDVVKHKWKGFGTITQVGAFPGEGRNPAVRVAFTNKERENLCYEINIEFLFRKLEKEDKNE